MKSLIVPKILQGIAPTIIAGFSDGAVRRPAYMICFAIYIGANFGLSLQSNYAALMVLRCLQSAGSSGTVTLAQGVVADVATSAERGIYVGLTSVPFVFGPILGPILGGLLTDYLGWRWIFWFLTIFSGSYLILFLLFFPETCRRVVGDGSINPPPLNRDLTSVIRERSRIRKSVTVDEDQKAEVLRTYKLSFPNPLPTMRIVADREAGLILFSGGLMVACLYAVNTGIPSQVEKIYRFGELKLGLVFIPFGSGSLLSAFTTGAIIDMELASPREAERLPYPKESVPRPEQIPLSSGPALSSLYHYCTSAASP